MTLTQTLPRAWKAFTNNKRYLLLTILLEFVFLFALTQLHLAFFTPSAEAATKLGEIMMKEIEKLPESEIYQLESILVENEEFMQTYRILLGYIGFFLVSILAAWIIFKAPIWHLSHKSILKKIPLTTTWLKFSLLSLFWFVILCIAFVIYSLATGATATLLPLVSSTTTTITMLIVFLAIYYFSQISFALIPATQTFKKTFILGIKHAKTILPAFIVNAIITFVVLTLPFNWITTKPLLSLAIMLVITIPALAFTRLHIIIATWLKHS